MTTTQAFNAHVEQLRRRAQSGCMISIQSLACISLLTGGWRPPPDGGGETVVEIAQYRVRRAA